MINGKRVLAYIPARSGSKSIVDKNIVDVCGKPLIAYSIEAAKNSKYVDKVVVSTDSEKYAEICREFGAEVPFLRPPGISGDLAKEMDACQHMMNWVKENWEDRFDIIVKLEPTSPLRTAEDIDRAVEKLIEKGADTVVTVTEAMIPPVWMNTLPEDHSLKNFISSNVIKKNRQELSTYYQLDGVVYVGSWNFIKEYKIWLTDNSYATITPNERSIDIDGPIQLELVRILIRERLEKNE